MALPRDETGVSLGIRRRQAGRRRKDASPLSRQWALKARDLCECTTAANDTRRSGSVARRTETLRPRTKPKTAEKPERLRKADIAKLVRPAQADIDDDAEEKQRGGVQSLGRA